MAVFLLEGDVCTSGFGYHDEVAKVEKVALDLCKDGQELFGNDEHLCPAVVEVVLVILGCQHGVDGDGDGADLHGAPENGIELGYVQHDHQDPVVYCYADLAESVGGLIGHFLHVVVSVVPVFRVHGRFMAPSLADVAIHEIIGCVEKVKWCSSCHVFSFCYMGEGGVPPVSRPATNI